MTIVEFEPYKNLPLSRFRDELSFEFPDLPEPLFDYWLIQSARKMARYGNLIRRRAVIQAQACVTRYRLESPDGMEVHAILGVKSAPDCGCGSHTVARTFDPPDSARLCGREIAWYDDIEKTFNVHPLYCHGQYFVSLAVTPGPDACELPEKFFNDYLPTLIMGAKANILLITNKKWTNLQLGNAYLAEFDKRIRVDAIDTATQRQRGSSVMSFGRIL